MDRDRQHTLVGQPGRPPLELVLFEHDVEQARLQLAAGISSFLIDLEVLGKDHRQLGFDTEIRPGTLADLAGIAALPGARPWCRINHFGDHTAAEVEAALDAGAVVVLLPMLSSLTEAEAFLELVGGRCETGVMIETVEAAALAPCLARLPIDCAFFGLNDYAISRGGGSIFRALVDGSVAEVRQALAPLSFGVGGLTDLRRGSPVPCRRLLEEIERLDCQFTFLRRSFRRDSQQRPAAEIVSELQAYWRFCAAREATRRRRDHQALAAIVNGLSS